jgi:hypothetical protein
MMLAAQRVHDPEDEAQESAQEEAGDQWERDRPAFAAPRYITGQTAQWKMQAFQSDHNDSEPYERKTKENQQSTERHMC